MGQWAEHEWERIATASRANEMRFKKALESILKLDRSKPYEFGELSPGRDYPGKGKRWATPKEIAEDALKTLL